MTPSRVTEALMAACRRLPAATEDVKWGNVLAFSVGGKMFATFILPTGSPISFKTDPHVYAELTQRPDIVPAPYLARAGWVSVEVEDALDPSEAEMLLAEAHEIVAEALPDRVQRDLGLID